MKGEKRRSKRQVDHDVFDSLEEAVTFVAERGGGIVYSLISQSSYAKKFGQVERADQTHVGATAR